VVRMCDAGVWWECFGNMLLFIYYFGYLWIEVVFVCLYLCDGIW
jgi:hypothetical protein